MANGSLFLDGKATTLPEIDRRLGELAKDNGEVWYYREISNSEGPDVVTKVMDLVIKYRLPISFSSKPDFSDTVGPEGVSRPRR